MLLLALLFLQLALPVLRLAQLSHLAFALGLLLARVLLRGGRIVTDLPCVYRAGLFLTGLRLRGLRLASLLLLRSVFCVARSLSCAALRVLVALVLALRLVLLCRDLGMRDGRCAHPERKGGSEDRGQHGPTEGIDVHCNPRGVIGREIPATRSVHGMGTERTVSAKRTMRLAFSKMVNGHVIASSGAPA